MATHISYNFQCPRCGADYIPYDTAVPCPNCFKVEEQRFDFVTRAVNAALTNQARRGAYTPVTFVPKSFADQVLKVCLELLQTHSSTGGKTFDEVVVEWTYLPVDWGDQIYVRDFIAGAARRVYEELQKQQAV